jgi:hypothetical protein
MVIMVDQNKYSSRVFKRLKTMSKISIIVHQHAVSKYFVCSYNENMRMC